GGERQRREGRGDDRHAAAAGTLEPDDAAGVAERSEGEGGDGVAGRRIGAARGGGIELPAVERRFGVAGDQPHGGGRRGLHAGTRVVHERGVGARDGADAGRAAAAADGGGGV